MQRHKEIWIWSFGDEDPLEKEMAIHSSILVWRISWTEEPGGPKPIGSQGVRHKWSNLACMHTCMHLLSFISKCDKIYLRIAYWWFQGPKYVLNYLTFILLCCEKYGVIFKFETLIMPLIFLAYFLCWICISFISEWFQILK